MAKHNEVVLLDARLSNLSTEVYPELDEDELFERAAIDGVLRERELTHHEIEDGIVDGADDGGIDAAYIFLNGELVSDESALRAVENPVIELEVLQAKREAGFTETALQKLIDHIPELTALGAEDDALRVEFNEKVVERFGLFRRVYLLHASRLPKLSVRVSYITKASSKPNSKVQAKAERLRKKIESDFPNAGVAISFFGAPELNVLARSRPNQSLELRLAEQPLSADLGGMVALVKLDDFVRFIRDDSGGIRESIFEENVRGYEGNTNINREISESLAADDSGIDFWWLNNGITVIGSRVSHAQKIVAIEDPQVVNGLQTSRAIYNHFDGDDDPRDARQLLVRVIEAPEDEVAAQIIKATNSQNRVPTASLRAAEPFQRNIEEFLLGKRKYYERRRNHYKNLGKKRADIVSVAELAQAVASIHLARPDEARGRPASLVRDKMYPKVFNSKFPLEFYWRCLQIMDEVERFLIDYQHLGRQERSNIRYHLARVAVAVAVSSSRPKPSLVVKVKAADLGDHLEVAYEWVVGEREKVAEKLDEWDFGTLAKSNDFSDHLNSRLSRYSAKQNWPKSLDSGWAR